MFLSIVFAIFVWPACMISGLIALVKAIRNLVKKAKSGDLFMPTCPDDALRSKYNIHYETPREEARRTEEYGYDDPRWGKL